MMDPKPGQDPYPSEKDDEILRRAKLDDDLAIQSACVRAWDYAIKFLRCRRSYAGNPPAQMEIADEVMSAAFCAIKKYDAERSQWITFVISITKNIAQSKYRRHGNEERGSGEDSSVDLRHPVELTPATEELKRVLIALARLGVEEGGEELKAVIELVFWNELSLREAAKLLGIPKSTLQGRYRKAIKKLRHSLRE